MAQKQSKHDKPILVKENEELVDINPTESSREGHERAHRIKHGGQRLDKRSARAVSGLPKKSGHGGKYTWNGPIDEASLDDEIPVILDEKDPNYVDEDEVVVAAKSVSSLVPTTVPTLWPKKVIEV